MINNRIWEKTTVVLEVLREDSQLIFCYALGN